MVGSFLLALLALSISENWQPHLDAIQNLMSALTITLIPQEMLGYAYMPLTVHTKHALLAIIAIGAYGFTTYLCITPTWKKQEFFPMMPSELPKEN